MPSMSKSSCAADKSADAREAENLSLSSSDAARTTSEGRMRDNLESLISIAGAIWLNTRRLCQKYRLSSSQSSPEESKSQYWFPHTKFILICQPRSNCFRSLRRRIKSCSTSAASNSSGVFSFFKSLNLHLL